MQRSVRIAWILVLFCVCGGWWFWPRRVLACSIRDPLACVDQGFYALWEGIAIFLWYVNRTLLQVAYALEAMRDWIIEVAFLSLWDGLSAELLPILPTVAMIALACMAFFWFLKPITLSDGPLKFNRILIALIAVPAILTLGGPVVAQWEQTRLAVGDTVYGLTSGMIPEGSFGVSGSDMGTVEQLFPSSACATPLPRYGAADGVTIVEQVAATFYADAEDIFCPTQGGPSGSLPDRWYDAAGPGYATSQSVGRLPEVDRLRAVEQMRQGAIVLAMGVVSSLLAVGWVGTQFLFTLCTLTVMGSLILFTPVAFFEQSLGPVQSSLRRAVTIFIVSALVAVLMGMQHALLRSIAELGNASLYNGVAFVSLMLTGGYLLFACIVLFVFGFGVFEQRVARVMLGNDYDQMKQSATQAAGMVGSGVAGAVTGGSSLALTGFAAAKHAGSWRYGVGAALGSVDGFAKVGSVGAALGMQHDVLDGMYAGYRADRSGGAWRIKQMAQAAAPQVQERAIASQLRRAEAPSRLRQDVRLLHRAGTAIQQAPSVVQRATASVRAAPARGWQSVRAVVSDIDDYTLRTATPFDMLHATVVAIDKHTHPSVQGHAASLNGQRVQWGERREDLTASEVTTRPRDEVNRVALLRQGYTVQENTREKTISYWK